MLRTKATPENHVNAEKRKRGRPPKRPEDKLQQLTIRLEHEDMEALQEMAEIHGISLSGAVERSVRIAAGQVTPAQRKALETMRKARAGT